MLVKVKYAWVSNHYFKEMKLLIMKNILSSASCKNWKNKMQQHVSFKCVIRIEPCTKKEDNATKN